MKKNMGWILIIAVVVLMAISQNEKKNASAGLDATRTFSSSEVVAGNTLIATYHPTTLNYFAIIEDVPVGWQPSKALSPDGKVRATGDGTDITITWTAPLIPGIYTFNGEYFVSPDTEWSTFTQNSITVNAASCTQSSDCVSIDTCKTGSCPSGVCVYTNAAINTTCTASGITDGKCDINGVCKTQVAPCVPSTCTDNNECTIDTDTCVNNVHVCNSVPVADGTACAGGTCQSGACTTSACNWITGSWSDCTVVGSACIRTRTVSESPAGCTPSETAPPNQEICTCPEETTTSLSCEIWEEEKDGKCKVSGIAMLFGGLIIFAFVISLLKRT